MPTVKIYDVVTNDRYELPVKYHLVGAKSVAKYLGVTENIVRQCLHRGRFKGEYKAVEVGVLYRTSRKNAKKGQKTRDSTDAERRC